MSDHCGVILMTYGSPATLEDVPSYMKNVRGGREPEPALVVEFQRRYQLIGGSPLLPITRAQAAALQEVLRQRATNGLRYSVTVGMRFAAPTVADGVAELVAQGVDRIIGIIMSPQYSPILMSGYHKALEGAVVALEKPVPVSIAGSWHRQPKFLEALAVRVGEAQQRVPEELRAETYVLLSAHSMPKPVVEREPDYIGQLHETAEVVAERAGLSKERWMFCYQSAGHTPEEWLKPDFADIMPVLAEQGCRSVIIAPVQFLSDHLEILYDIEVGAREQAEEHDIHFTRTSSLNTSPLFIDALADLVAEVAAGSRLTPVS